MEKSSYYLEIFGDIDDVAPPIHSRPAPDLDNALFDFSKATQTHEVNQLVDAAFVDQLVGNIPDAPRPEPTAITKSDVPYLDNLLEELLPTVGAMASMAPAACASFEKLIKFAARPSKSNKTCHVEIEMNDGTRLCCPEENEDGDYVKAGKVYPWIELKSIQACREHCKVTA